MTSLTRQPLRAIVLRFLPKALSAGNGAGPRQPEQHRVARPHAEPLGRRPIQHDLRAVAATAAARRNPTARSDRRSRSVRPDWPERATADRHFPGSPAAGWRRRRRGDSEKGRHRIGGLSGSDQSNSSASAARKKWSVTSASSMRPRRSRVSRRRLPRIESPTSRAPVNTAAPTATPHATARFVRQ